VVVSTELSPPRPPTGLTATPAGDGAYRVAWRAAAPGSFPVRGYRVHRDGQVLGQGGETSRLVTGLQQGRTHRIEVQTVDSTGELSPKSVPLEISLDPPTPSTGTGRAFLLASTDRSFEDFQRNYMKIGRVYPTYFDCLADGTFVGRDDPRITRWAQARRIQVLARVNCQRTSTLNRILNEPVLRERWLSRIVEVARDHGYEGINIDFEAGLWTDRNALSDFVTELSARLRAEGRIVSICVSAKAHDNNKQHPRNGIFDYPVISAQVDEVLVMSWGWHWLTSPHGPISPLTWLTGVAQYTSSMPHRDRFVMGSPMYGIDWPQGSGSSNPGTALEYDQIQALIARVGATPQRDPASGELYFSYTAGGIQRNVRYMDAESLRIKHATAAAAGIPRTFLWRMGNEDQAIWNLPSVSG
jgi:spore germination protein YaaH